MSIYDSTSILMKSYIRALILQNLRK